MNKQYTLEATPVASAKELKDQKTPKAKRIAVGTDVHLRSYQATRKVDNAAIGAVANFRSEAELLLYVDKQCEQAEEVVVVYEAGPLGYGLYRQLTARGAKCLVCAPDSTQQQRKRRKNNQIDARTLTSNLFNRLNGNEAALQLVRVPTLEQEQARLASRQHDQLVEERKRLGAKGNALLLSQGFGSWKNCGGRRLLAVWSSACRHGSLRCSKTGLICSGLWIKKSKRPRRLWLSAAVVRGPKGPEPIV